MTGAFGVIYLVGLIVGAIPAVGFPVLYTIWSPWWRSEMGRHLFTFSLLFALLYTNGLVHLLFSIPQPVQVWINLFYVGFGAVVAWQRILVYLHAQRHRVAGAGVAARQEAEPPDS